MPSPWHCWGVGALLASVRLARGTSPQTAAGACVDQDDRWAAHGSNCAKMKRLCDDKGYGPLVRRWCPKSCGLCSPDDTQGAREEALEANPAAAAPPSASEARPTSAAVAAAGPSPAPRAATTTTTSAANSTQEWSDLNSSLAAAAQPTTTTTEANSTWEWADLNDSAASAGQPTTTTTEAAPRPGTTTTTEASRLPAANLTDNGTCAAEASSDVAEELAEVPLVYRYAPGPEALVAAGGPEVVIEGPAVLVLGEAAQSFDTASSANSTLPAGYNSTSAASAHWEVLTPLPDDLPVEATTLTSGADGNGSYEPNATEFAVYSEPSPLVLWLEEEEATTFEIPMVEAGSENTTITLVDTASPESESVLAGALSQLDDTLRGKRTRHHSGARGRRHVATAGSARRMEEPDQGALARESASRTPAPEQATAAAVREESAQAYGELAFDEEQRQCPKGYERVAGDVYGGDQFSGKHRAYAESLEECGSRCSRTPGCGSFEYSPTRKQCFRNSQTRPTHDKDRLDFVFCRRAPCPSLKTEEACVGPAVAAGHYTADVALRPGSYCIWSGGACQAPMACTEKDCFLPDGGLPGMELPRWQTLWISRAGLEASMLPTSLAR